MNKTYTPIFDINKSLPVKYRNKSTIYVQFKRPYSIYLQTSLEPNFLLLETELLARFKRVMYDGRIAPTSELYKVVFGPHILTAIDPTGMVNFIDLKEGLQYWIEGKYLEELQSHTFNFCKEIEEDSIIISDETFATEIIEHYKLDNLYNTKLMKIYSSTYFDSYGPATNQEKLPMDSLVGDIESEFSGLQED